MEGEAVESEKTESEITEREIMEFDVLIVGAGPAGLAAAYRAKKQASDAGNDLQVCVIEKGSEVGAHILSGAVMDTRALDELIPDWKEKGAPLNVEVTEDQVFLLSDNQKSRRIPNAFVPKPMHNDGNYICLLYTSPSPRDS